VCNNLAVCSGVDVAWFRPGFVLGSPVTGGPLVALYMALIFILPVAPKPAT